jgi:cytidylate kinase
MRCAPARTLRNVESMNKSLLQIAIDGPAASGKSTLGQAIAGELRYRLLDTGQMYRAVTREALKRGVPSHDAEALTQIAVSTYFDLGSKGLKVDGVPAGQDLHAPEVDAAVSAVSAHPAVRAVLVRLQRELADNRCIVMVGRDIGTTVLPDAPVKLWVTASDEERARRRLRDQPEEVVREGHVAAQARLGSRDRYDSTRAHSPLQKARDAILIDTDGRSPRQVLDQAMAVIQAARGDGPS